MTTGLSAALALVVDPDPEIRDLYGGILAPIAKRIEYAEEGREALAKAIGHPPSFVITETRLPFIDGYALCSLLRADPLTSATLIVIASEDGDRNHIERARSSGADSVLIKPCQPDALLNAIARGRDHFRSALERPNPSPSLPASTDRTKRTQVRAYHRFETTAPPIAPPPLRCPLCDQSLRYTYSHLGGVSARLSEQWDYYTCPNPCGTFQYRQRTRRLRRVQ